MVKAPSLLRNEPVEILRWLNNMNSEAGNNCYDAIAAAPINSYLWCSALIGNDGLSTNFHRKGQSSAVSAYESPLSIPNQDVRRYRFTINGYLLLHTKPGSALPRKGVWCASRSFRSAVRPTESIVDFAAKSDLFDHRLALARASDLFSICNGRGEAQLRPASCRPKPIQVKIGGEMLNNALALLGSVTDDTNCRLRDS